MTSLVEEPISRSIEVRIGIDAPPEIVWKALTDPAELVRWFSLDARVVPGIGGSVWLSWGEPVVAHSQITRWEPNYRLSTVETRPLGVLLEPGGANNAPRTMDYLIRPLRGGTELRIVHSGFRSGSYWEELYSAVRRGWEFQLRSLRNSLARHAGTDRSIASVRRSLHLRADAVWSRFMGVDGLLGTGSLGSIKEGDPYSIRTVAEDIMEGTVLIHEPPKQFAVTVANWNDSLFRVYLVEGVTGVLEANLWLAVYGGPQHEVAAFQQRWRAVLEQSLG